MTLPFHQPAKSFSKGLKPLQKKIIKAYNEMLDAEGEVKRLIREVFAEGKGDAECKCENPKVVTIVDNESKCAETYCIFCGGLTYSNID